MPSVCRSASSLHIRCVNQTVDEGKRHVLEFSACRSHIYGVIQCEADVGDQAGFSTLC